MIRRKTISKQNQKDILAAEFGIEHTFLIDAAYDLARELTGETPDSLSFRAALEAFKDVGAAVMMDSKLANELMSVDLSKTPRF